MHSDWLGHAVPPEDAVKHIKSGDRVFLHSGCATSLPLEAAFAEYAKNLRDVTVMQLHKDGPEVLADPALQGHVRINALFLGAGNRQAVAEGWADYVPVFLSDIPHHIRNGSLPVDVALVQLSYPDQHGFCSLGTSVDVARQAVDSAKVVIAEINYRMPRTHGSGFVHVSELDAFIVTDRPVIEKAHKAPDQVAQDIGRHIGDLVPDGATLQMGIGAIPDAVLASLTTKHDLGIHTEMFTDGLVDLVESGVVTNRLKTHHKGTIVTSFVIGTRKVYDFVDDNPLVEFHPSDYVNDTSFIRKQYRMTAINCAIEVDLTGQVCADSIGTKIYSGIGGQMDFVRGAALAPEGKAIIALPSTAKNGTISRIKAILTPGAGVVTTRGHVEYVVTEFGAACLSGKNLRQRAEALIAIAHPDHRAELRKAAAERKLFMMG